MRSLEIESYISNFLVKNEICKNKSRANCYIKYLGDFITPKNIKFQHELILKKLRKNPDLSTSSGLTIIDEIETAIYYALIMDHFLKYLKKNSGLNIIREMPSNAEATEIFKADKEVSFFTKLSLPINFDAFRRLQTHNFLEVLLSFHSFSRDMLILTIEEEVSKYNVCKFDTIRTILKEIENVSPLFLGFFGHLEAGESSQFYKNIYQMQQKYTDKLSKLKDTNISKFLN